jgi:hypothetical protein
VNLAPSHSASPGSCVSSIAWIVLLVTVPTLLFLAAVGVVR